MMIIYIAGRITGDSQYKLRFQAAADKLESLGFTVLNPASLPEGMGYEQYMNICFPMLKEADIICLLTNYRDSPGALRELEYAKQLGKIIIGGNYGE